LKAVVKTRPGPGLELIDVPVPVVEAGDVLVKVNATGI
jgi:threonine 3-dehydrogenase